MFTVDSMTSIDNITQYTSNGNHPEILYILKNRTQYLLCVYIMKSGNHTDILLFQGRPDYTFLPCIYIILIQTTAKRAIGQVAFSRVIMAVPGMGMCSNACCNPVLCCIP